MLHQYIKDKTLVNTVKVLRNEQLKRAGYVDKLDGRTFSRYGVDTLHPNTKEAEVEYAKKLLFIVTHIYKYKHLPIQLFIMMFGEVIALGSNLTIKQLMYKPNLDYGVGTIKPFSERDYDVCDNNVSSAFFKRCNGMVKEYERPSEVKRLIMEIMYLNTKDMKW